MARAILKNCQIIDGLKEEPLVNGIIVVEDERISWVGQASDFDLKLEKNATIIDMNGMYVLPGLWDMHLHLDYQGLKDIAAPRTVAQRTLFSYRRALTFLYNGVTSLRLVGTSDGIDFALRDGIARGDYLGPRILTAGKGINSTGGHGSKDGTGFDGPYEFRRAARQVVFKGADLVKVMVTVESQGEMKLLMHPKHWRMKLRQLLRSPIIGVSMSRLMSPLLRQRLCVLGRSRYYRAWLCID